MNEAYRRGRRAAERCCERSVPVDIQLGPLGDSIDWIQGYDSAFGGIPPRDIHQAVKDAIEVLRAVDSDGIDAVDAIGEALAILGESM